MLLLYNVRGFSDRSRYKEGDKFSEEDGGVEEKFIKFGKKENETEGVKISM